MKKVEWLESNLHRVIWYLPTEADSVLGRLLRQTDRHTHTHTHTLTHSLTGETVPPICERKGKVLKISKAPLNYSQITCIAADLKQILLLAY